MRAWLTKTTLCKRNMHSCFDVFAALFLPFSVVIVLAVMLYACLLVYLLVGWLV